MSLRSACVEMLSFPEVFTKIIAVLMTASSAFAKKGEMLHHVQQDKHWRLTSHVIRNVMVITTQVRVLVISAHNTLVMVRQSVCLSPACARAWAGVGKPGTATEILDVVEIWLRNLFHKMNINFTIRLFVHARIMRQEIMPYTGEKKIVTWNPFNTLHFAERQVHPIAAPT